MFMYIMHMCSTHINQKRHALERLLRRSQDNWMTICIVDEICCQQKHILRAIYAQPSMQQQNNRTLKRSNFDFLSFCWFVDALEILHAIYDFVGNKIGLPKPMHVVVFFFVVFNHVLSIQRATILAFTCLLHIIQAYIVQ